MNSAQIGYKNNTLGDNEVIGKS